MGPDQVSTPSAPSTRRSVTQGGADRGPFLWDTTLTAVLWVSRAEWWPMTDLDDECKHGPPLGTCTYCSGKETAAQSHGTGGRELQRSLDTPESLETYRDRYPVSARQPSTPTWRCSSASRALGVSPEDGRSSRDVRTLSRRSQGMSLPLSIELRS